MTKIGVKDASAMVRNAMDRLEATAGRNKSVKIDDIKDKDLRALAEAASGGAGDRVTLTKLRETLKTIGTEIKSVDQKAHGGDADGKLDFAEAAKLSPLAARMLDWAVDGKALAESGDAVMWVQPKDIDDAARGAMALLRSGLPAGRGKVKLADAKGDKFLQSLIEAAAQRISDEGPTTTRTIRVPTGCGGSSSRTITELKYSPADILDQGVSRAKLREILTDAKNFLADDVVWYDPREGQADIASQRYSVDDSGPGADKDYGAGTGNAALAIFDLMAANAAKGNMRPSADDLAAMDRADADAAAARARSRSSSGRSVSSGC